MDYVLIKNGLITRNSKCTKGDILICENKIIDIGSDLSRPNLETPVIDAGGKYIMPGILDINRNFYHLFKYDHQQLERLLQSQIISGTTFWIDTVTMHEIQKAEMHLNAKGFSMPDYTFHILVDADLCNQLNKLPDFILRYGISSLMIHWPLVENISQPQINKLFAVAAEYDLLMVCDFQFSHHFEAGDNIDFSEEVAGYHIKSLKDLTNLIKQHNVKACFLNIQYAEELQILKELRETQNIYAELNFTVTLGTKEAFTQYEQEDTEYNLPLNSISANQVIKEVVTNEWCLIGRSGISVFNEELLPNIKAYNRPNDYFIFKYFLPILSSVMVNESRLNPTQMTQILSNRPAELFGLSPVKGALKIGADADLIIWDADYERNLYISISHPQQDADEYKLKGRTEFVFMKGRIIYNGEQILSDTVTGDYLFRYS